MRALLWPDATDQEHARELAELAGSFPLVLVAQRPAGLLAGFLELSIRAQASSSGGPLPYVEGWYVDADVRRRGVGRALVAEAEHWARRRGYAELGSDTEIERLHSIAAHQALGFSEVERLVIFRKAL